MIGCKIVESIWLQIQRKFQVVRDKDPVFKELSFIGVIQEICELEYNVLKVVVFKCDWVKSNGAVIEDELGFTLIDLSIIGYNSDVFIMDYQAKHLFYVEYPSDTKWSIVLFPHKRNIMKIIIMG